MRARNAVALRASVLVVSSMIFVSQSRAQASAERPSKRATAVPDSSYYPHDEELGRAIDAVVRHRHRDAIKLARARVQASPAMAWRVIGVSACSRKDVRTAAEARQNLDAEGKSLVEYVCNRYEVALPNSKQR